MSSIREFIDPNTKYHTIIIHFSKPEKIVCDNCGSLTKPKVLRTKKQIIKYSTPYEDNLILVLYRRVYQCTECGKSFKETNPFTNKKFQISKAKINKVLVALEDKHKTFVDAAKQFDISVSKSQEIFDNNVHYKRLKLPKVLSIDESYRKRLTKTKYICVLYDQFTDEVIDILNSRHKDFLIEYFSLIPKDEIDNVYCITIDLYKTYRDVASMFFPKAIICADSFHVIKNLHSFFDHIRIQIMNKFKGLKKYTGSAYSKLKKYSKLLFKNPGELDIKIKWKKIFQKQMSCVEVVDQILNIDSDLREAYELMQDYKIFNDCATIEDAPNMLDNLIYRFSKSKFIEFNKFGSLLKNWYFEIVNSFLIVDGKRVSNGPLENTNRHIKDYLKMSYSARDFKRARNRLLHILRNK